MFTVTGNSEGTSTIVAKWRGYPEPQCIDVGEQFVTVIVCDKPTFPSTISLGDSTSATFTVSTQSACSFLVTASAVGGSLSGLSVSPASVATVNRDKLATYRIQIDPNDAAFYRNVEIEWIGPSGEARRGLITVLRGASMPQEQKTTAATPSARSRRRCRPPPAP